MTAPELGRALAARRGWRRWGLLGLVATAFILRLIASLPPAGQVPDGYDYYLEMADNVTAGRGLQREMPFGQGARFAIRGPGYPLILAGLSALPGERGAAIAAFGSACGALSVLFVALLAMRLFGAVAGWIAGIVACAWPYAVVHDGALQDTALYTMLLLAVLLLAREAGARASLLRFALAGMIGAAAVLVRAPLLPSVVALIVIATWMAAEHAGTRRAVPCLALALLCLELGLAPWQLRNASVVGRPVLTSDTGRSLWLGNNPELFAVYPRQSIDRAEERAWTALPEATRAHVRSLGGDEIAQDRWFLDEAMSFIRAHPGDALLGALRKAWATYSPVFNPSGGRLKALAHAISYGPIALLALLALWRLRARWREMLPFIALVALLAIQSAVFFGHSGYRAYVDPLLIVLASSWLATRASSEPRVAA